MPATIGPGDYVKVSYQGRDRPVRDRDGQLVEVIFDDETPLTLMWDSRPYVIAVGEEAHVPFEAMSLALGDPRSAENMASYRDERGNTGFVLDRATEVRRLRTLYDNQMGPEGEVMYAPQATVVDLEGEEVTTVLDDPQGAGVIPVPTTALDRDQLLAQLQRQQRMIEQLAEAQGIDLADNPDDDTSEDAPPEPLPEDD
jgi:hypothetical protein